MAKKISRRKAQKSLLEKLKSKNIKVDYPYENVKLTYSYSSGGVKENRMLNIFDSFIKRDLGNKVPMSTVIGYNFDSVLFLNDVFDNIEKFYFINAYDIDFSREKDVLLDFTTVFKYKNILFSITQTTISVIYFDSSDFYSNVDLFKTIGNKYVLMNESKSKIKIILKENNYYVLKNYETNKINLDISLNYEDSFKKVDAIIKQKLKKTSKGIIILHGEKGTGKTNYIRHLIHTVNKNFIYIPSYLSSSLCETNFMTFLINQCSNSVLIMEDSENFLKSREGVTGNNNGISDILNITDGILSDVMKIQFICTLNTKLNNIDTALTRDGRLIAEYHFNKLPNNKAVLLAKKLKKVLPNPNNDYTLAEIYNIGEDIPKNKINTKTIGFEVVS